MIAHRLKQSFDRFYPAPLRVWENFASFCKIVHFRKNEVIKAANTRETHGYFILEGSADCFAWKEAQYIFGKQPRMQALGTMSVLLR